MLVVVVVVIVVIVGFTMYCNLIHHETNNFVLWYGNR